MTDRSGNTIAVGDLVDVAADRFGVLGGQGVVKRIDGDEALVESESWLARVTAVEIDRLPGRQRRGRRIVIAVIVRVLIVVAVTTILRFLLWIFE